MELVSQEVSRKEIEKWLSNRRVSERKQKDFEDTIEELTSYVSSGILEYDEDSKCLKQNLEFPLGENGGIKQLTYSPRLTVAEVRSAMSSLNAKSSDAEARIVAHIAAATKQPAHMVLKLDTVDYSVASNIALFFL